MSIRLCPVTRDNWEAVIRLQVAPEQQGFVASNCYSVAQSFYEPGTVLLAIYADERIVGLLMYGLIDEAMWIWRLMIDRRHQRRGYGRQALVSLLQSLRALGYREVFISYEPDNAVAAKLYASVGFALTGARDAHGETVARIELSLVDPG